MPREGCGGQAEAVTALSGFTLAGGTCGNRQLHRHVGIPGEKAAKPSVAGGDEETRAKGHDLV